MSAVFFYLFLFYVTPLHTRVVKVYPEVTFEEEMMSQRFTLFYAGFTAYAPALYFNQLELIASCKNDEDEAVENYISTLSKEVGDKEFESISHLKTAISIAGSMEIEILPQPFNFEDYSAWLNHYTTCFEKEFPMGRIDHYYFLFARKISEISVNLGLLNTYVDLMTSSKGSMDLSRKIEKCLKDIEYILFKLMAAAALLSSEPRQNYFNVYYRSLCQEYLPFKDIDTKALEEADLKKLHGFAQDFDLVVMDGFKKCIGLLKELGI